MLISFKETKESIYDNAYIDGYNHGMEKGWELGIKVLKLNLKEKIQKARDNGVPEDEILHNLEESDEFFKN